MVECAQGAEGACSPMRVCLGPHVRITASRLAQQRTVKHELARFMISMFKKCYGLHSVIYKSKAPAVFGHLALPNEEESWTSSWSQLACKYKIARA
jgi:hypothetical protein